MDNGLSIMVLQVPMDKDHLKGHLCMAEWTREKQLLGSNNSSSNSIINSNNNSVLVSSNLREVIMINSSLASDRTNTPSPTVLYMTAIQPMRNPPWSDIPRAGLRRKECPCLSRAKQDRRLNRTIPPIGTGLRRFHRISNTNISSSSSPRPTNIDLDRTKKALLRLR